MYIYTKIDIFVHLQRFLVMHPIKICIFSYFSQIARILSHLQELVQLVFVIFISNNYSQYTLIMNISK